VNVFNTQFCPQIAFEKIIFGEKAFFPIGLNRLFSLPLFTHPPTIATLFNHTGYAIPAVNCVSNSGINACLEAARKNDAPIIIQFSSGGSQVSLS